MSAKKFDFTINAGRLVWDKDAAWVQDRCRVATDPEIRMWKRIQELERQVEARQWKPIPEDGDGPLPDLFDGEFWLGVS